MKGTTGIYEKHAYQVTDIEKNKNVKLQSQGEGYVELCHFCVVLL